MICAAEDMCMGEVYALGLCPKHYKRWWRHGVLYSPRELAGLKTSQRRKREYYLANREKRLAYQKARREADLEAAREYERGVYQRRRGRHQAANRARERRMDAPNRDTVEYDAILRRDPCSYCGAPAEQVDHIVPVISGGKNHWTNLTASCATCNRAKSARTLLHFSSSGR